MKCNFCGNENAENARFCTNCGSALERDTKPVVDTFEDETHMPAYTAPVAPEEPKAAEPIPAPQPQPQAAPQYSQQSQQQPQYAQQAQQQSQYGQYYAPQQPQYTAPAAQAPVIPAAYKPLSAWAYFGYQLLFSIPLVGLIMMIVFACGGTENINLRNYARSYFCALLVAVIIVVVVLVLVLVLGGSLALLDY